MSFDKILGSLTKSIPGAVGAVFVDWEGESISHYPPEDKEMMRLCGAYQGIVHNQVKTYMERAEVGEVLDILIDLTNYRFLLFPIHSDYLLVLVLGPDALTFVAGQLGRQAVGEIIDEIGTI